MSPPAIGATQSLDGALAHLLVHVGARSQLEKSVLFAAHERGELVLVDCRLAEGFWLLRRR